MEAFDWDGVIQSISRDGWDKGPGQPAQGPGCVLRHAQRVKGIQGSITEWIIPYSDLRAEAAQLAPHVRAQFPDRLVAFSGLSDVDAVVDFNDHPDTTDDDVIMVMEKARANATPTWTAEDNPGV